MKRRIIVCLGLLLALCLIGDAIALVCLNTSIGQLTTLAEAHRIQSLRVELASSGIRLERDLLAAASSNAHDSVNWRDSMQRFEDSLGACNDCHHDVVVQASLNRLWQDFRTYRTEMSRLAATGNITDEARNLAVQDLADSVSKRSTEMSDLAAKHLGVKNSVAAAGVHRAWAVLSGTLIASLLVGGLIAMHLKQRLTAPIEALLEGIGRIRAGDLNHRFSIDADEEFRQLGRAFNQANESLTSAQESILQAEKMAAVGKLAAGVAHEVGNPLASISSVAQMMRRDCESPKQAERIDLIMQHIGRVSRVVRELLTFSRPVYDRRQGHVEINSVLDHAVSLLRYDKRAGHAQISCSCDSGLSIAQGDSDRLLLVFTNIMINAFDALSCHRNGQARLTITGREVDDRILLQFEDNGPGMTAEQISNAFEPFFTTKQPGTGTGLGLWICYQVIQKHDGRISIHSVPGQGTTVVIELPNRQYDTPESATSCTPHESVPVSP